MNAENTDLSSLKEPGSQLRGEGREGKRDRENSKSECPKAQSGVMCLQNPEVNKQRQTVVFLSLVSNLLCTKVGVIGDTMMTNSNLL